MLTPTVRVEIFTLMYSCVCFCQSFVTHDTKTPSKKVFSKPRRENFSTTTRKRRKKVAAEILIDLKFPSFFLRFFLFFELKSGLGCYGFMSKWEGRKDEALWQTWTNNVYITYGEKAAKVSCWLIRSDDISGGCCSSTSLRWENFEAFSASK
jgi:hypothetical protein